MNDAEDVCGCLACAALCGVCCVAAAEEDKRERERAAAEATGRLKNPNIQVNPVAVLSPRSQKAAAAASARGATPAATPDGGYAAYGGSGSGSGSGSAGAGGIGGGARAPLPLADPFHYQDHYHSQPRSPPRRTARKSASYRSNAYLPPASR